ncbi:hypothetical protein ACJW30_09G027000 [Castanea mollissima]
MKLVVLFLVIMVVSSSCLAVPMRGILGGIYGQEQLYHAQKRKAMEDSKEESKVEYPDSSINNHHTIPRQNFNSGEGSSQGENGDSNGGGSG